MAEEQKQSAELRLKLIIDDQTQETVNRLKEGLGGIDEATKRVTDGTHKMKEGFGGIGEHTRGIETSTHDIAKGVFEGMAYWEATKVVIEGIEEALKSTYEIAEKVAEEAIHAADAAMTQERGVSGLMHFMDRGEHSMAGLAQYAGEVREELEEAGQQAGVSTEQMTDMFSTIVERGHLSSEQAKELTMQMAEVGKITRGGMGGLAEGFAMMEIGIVRARNPLVQLIATMDILHGNARSVAQQMQKLTPEKQMEMAQKAIEKQAEALKSGGGVQLTLPEYKKSFESYREMFFEGIGRPMMETLLPVLSRIQNWLGQNAKTIKDWAGKIGSEFANVVEVLTNVGGGIYDAIHENWGEIKQTMLDATAGVRAAWENIKDNQMAIAGTFKDVVKDLIGVASWTAAHAPGAGKQDPRIRDLEKAAADPSQLALHAGEKSKFGDLEQQFHATTEQWSDDLRKQIEGIEHNANRTRDWAHEVEKYAQQIQDAQDRISEATPGTNVDDLTDLMQQGADSFAGQVREAATRGDTAMEQWAADFVSKDETLAMSLINAKEKMGPAFDDFAKMVEEKGGPIADLFKKLAGVPSNIKPGTGSMNVNFNGGITIHQDFRDQDPDRIIVAFRRDLVRHAVARLDARTNTGFGGL